MTQVGAGGVVISSWSATKRFSRDFKKLTADYQERVKLKLKDLTKPIRPPGLRFEKLKGYDGIYTIHIDGNYKLSMCIDGSAATLRRVADHDDIDRAP